MLTNLNSFMKGYELSNKKVYALKDGSATGLLNDIVGKELKIVGYVIDQHENKEGKMKSRTFIVCQNGETYVTASNFIVMDLERIVDCFGEPSVWDEELTVQVIKEKAGRSGNSRLKLKLVD